MPPVLIALDDAMANLSQLVDRASAGEEILIVKDGVARARLVPLRERVAPRVPGGWEGRVVIADDFDAPLEREMLRLFE